MPKKKRSKEISEEQEEKSELEEEIEEGKFEEIAEKVLSEDSTEKIIDDNSFREFIQTSVKSTASVLEKVVGPQEPVDLEQNIAFAPDTEKKREVIDYITTSNEPEYSSRRNEEIRMENENLLIKSSAPIRIKTARANLRPEIEQHFQINPELHNSMQARTGNTEEELYIKAGRLEENNGLPFEGGRKYKGRPI